MATYCGYCGREKAPSTPSTVVNDREFWTEVFTESIRNGKDHDVAILAANEAITALRARMATLENEDIRNDLRARCH